MKSILLFVLAFVCLLATPAFACPPVAIASVGVQSSAVAVAGLDYGMSVQALGVPVVVQSYAVAVPTVQAQFVALASPVCIRGSCGSSIRSRSRVNVLGGGRLRGMMGRRTITRTRASSTVIQR